ncbi:MAG: hypothetical protein WCK14_12535 [Actinomycetota bacterium]|jgi:hypothetical protein
MKTVLLHQELTGTQRPRSDYHRSFAVDAAIALSSAAALAHAASTPSHYSWWALSGEFFAFLALAQGTLAYRLFRKPMSDAALRIGVWGTVAVVAVYVVSRTVGIPCAPEIAGHGGAVRPGRSIVPGAAKYVGAFDLLTLAAELALIMILTGLMSKQLRQRTSAKLMWVGLAMWALAGISAL